MLSLTSIDFNYNNNIALKVVFCHVITNYYF